MLLFDGPCKRGEPNTAVDHTDYHKTLEQVYQSNLRTLDAICRDVYTNFGDYKELTHNCKTFVSMVLERFGVYCIDFIPCLDKEAITKVHLQSGVAPCFSIQNKVVKPETRELEQMKESARKFQELEEIEERCVDEAMAGKLLASKIAALNKSLDAIGDGEEHAVLRHEMAKTIAKLETELEQIAD